MSGMDGRKNKCMGGGNWKNGWVSGWKNEYMSKWKNECMGG